MVEANAFIVLQEDVSHVKKGEHVLVQLLDETLTVAHVTA
jgi:molybdopterin biosynthesis enzyme